MDSCTDGLNILSMAVQEHSKTNSALCRPSIKTQSCCNIKNETGHKNEKQTISHRQIEKRRRDRINNTLWMLKDLVPAAKRKFTSGSGRLEKADLLEMTIQHIKEIHRNLSSLEGKEKEKYGNSEALNDSYNTGFRDGMVHVLDVMKKMNMLTQTQTELLLKESMAIQENRNKTEVVEWNNSAEVAQKSQANLLFGGMVTQSCHSDCEMAKQDAEDKPLSNSSVEEVTSFIKREKLCAAPADACENSVDNGSSTTRPPFDQSIDNFSSPASLPLLSSSFHKQTSLSVNNGTQNPILLPVYALHASGSHYVPVFLPPSSILPTDPG